MRVGQLRTLLRRYDKSLHVGIVWPRAPQGEEAPWLAELEKLIIATDQETGETDIFLEAAEVETE